MCDHCPKCGSEERSKAGFIGAAQRWLCKGWGCKYTRSTSRGMPMEIKRRALQLYLEGLGFRAIGRLLGVSNVAVLKWIRAFGEDVEHARKPGPPPRMVMIDEMWHFIHTKKTSHGSGYRCVISTDASSAFIWADGEPKT